MTKHEKPGEAAQNTNDKSSDDLRADVERTRQRLSQEVEALGTKLSPDNLKGEAKQAIKRTVRRGREELREGVDSATSSVSSFVAQNPLPIALIGAGLGWLVWNVRNKPQHNRQLDYATRGRAEVYDDSYDEDAWNGEATARGVGQQLHRLGSQVREGVQTVKRSASAQANRARAKVDELESTAREQWDKSVDAAERGFDEQPLLLGAVALGAGLAVGLGIPATESENQLVGQYRDKLMATAKGKLGELRGKAEGVVEHTYEAAKQTVQAETQDLRESAPPA